MTLPPDLPRVSVLLPVYNAEEYVPAMLESLHRQTLSDFEVIMVDDGSTDRSGALLEQAAAADTRFRLIRQAANTGIVAALNRGLDECRAPYVARMDADDIALPDRFERQVAHLEANPDIVALGTSLAYIDARGKSLDRVRRCALGGSMLRGNPLLHPTVMLRRSVLEQHAIRYRAEYIYAEDYYLWLELSRLGRLAALDEVAYLYRVSDTTLRSRKLRNMIRATLRVKLTGWRRLGLRPTPADLFGMAVEAGLLFVPPRLVWQAYLWALPLAAAARAGAPRGRRHGRIRSSRRRHRSGVCPMRAAAHPRGAPPRMS
jgi:glycosyltransferase involved in cell wall biosynthesis